LADDRESCTGRYWVLFMDLDGTLWDHLDISRLQPPFTLIGEGVLRDVTGVRVKLYRDAVKLIEWAKESCGITSALSWNLWEPAVSALKASGVIDLFDYLAIEPHPGKGEMAEKVIKRIESTVGYTIPPCRIVYIDDRIIHLEDIRGKLGDVFFLRAWRDFRDFEEARGKIIKHLSSC